MMFLRQSTASQEVLLGPFLDDTDGKTAETALTINNTDIKIWKRGGTTESSKNSGGATHIASGRYYAVLDATDTDTVGDLAINVHVSGALPVRLVCCVLEEVVFDQMFAASAAGYQVPIWSSASATVSLTNTTVATVTTTTTATNVTTVNGLAANVITAASIASNAIDADAIATDAVTEIQAGLSTLTQAQVTGGAYALNSASFAFNAALDFTTTQKAATLARVTLADTVTTYTGNTPQTGDAYAVVSNGTHGNAALKTLVDDVPTTAEFNARTLAAADYFDPAADKVYLGDGAQGGSSMVLTAERFVVASTTLNEPAIKATGNGSGGGMQLSSPAGWGLVSNGVKSTGNVVFDDQFSIAGLISFTSNITANGRITATNAENDIRGIQVNDLTTAAKALVQTEVQDAIEANHLDHLFAADYDPASKPGVATALLNELIGDDLGVSQFTANALELAPTGGSAPTVGQIADEVQTRTIAAVTLVNGLAANTITAAALAADAVTEIQSGLSTLTQTQVTGGAYSIQSASCVLGDARVANLDATVSSRLATAGYTSPPSAGTISTQVASDLAAAHGAGSWATATGFSTHSAADVWAVGARTLTAFGFTVTTANAADVTAILADTNEMQTDWANGGRLDLILDDILADTGTTLQAELDGIQADTEDIQSRLPAALVSGRMDSSVGAMAANVLTASALASDAATEIFTAVLTSQLTESYAADGVAPTLAQAVFLIQQAITEFTISGTTTTIKKLDGSTTAATLTLNDGTTPTGVTRST